ncbi:Ldh family oxidoreductase [Actinokineospora guangxiensis]|uniref:Ldh family oxidoreductase n=1 Tax=Actinokineospora guangxiensis TaxID=1490288 RepID=A0ABW0ETY3_9PSEU
MTDLDTAPAPASTRVPVGALLDFTAAVLFAHGLPAARATAAAEALCHGDITGSPEHGLTTLARVHLPLLASGRVDPDAEPRVAADRGAAVLLDAADAPGLWLACEAADLACRRAAAHGVGVVAVRGGLAYGRPGHAALRAARRGMVGVVTLADGTLAVAAPGGGRPPLLLDADPGGAGALGLAVRVLAALVPGAGIGPLSGGTGDTGGSGGCTALVLAPGALRGADAFDRDAAALLTPFLDPHGAYPGCREARLAAEADARGVPLSHRLVDDLVALARGLGLRVPDTC